jgi:hypothetical protein
MRKDVLIAVAAGLAVLAGCRGAAVDSQWKSQEIVIDGDGVEWQSVVPNTPKPAVDLRAVNDGKFLYLCLTTREKRLVRECLTMGLTVWFKPNGRQSQKLGIHFPLGLAAAGPRQSPPKEASQEAVLQQALAEMEILGPGEEQARRFRVSDAAYYGIGVSFHPIGDSLVYELKVPLSGQAASDFFAGSSADGVVQMKFETGEKEYRGPPQRSMQELDPEYGLNSIDDVSSGYSGGRLYGASPHVNMGTVRQFYLSLAVKLAGQPAAGAR